MVPRREILKFFIFHRDFGSIHNLKLKKVFPFLPARYHMVFTAPWRQNGRKLLVAPLCVKFWAIFGCFGADFDRFDLLDSFSFISFLLFLLLLLSNCFPFSFLG